MTIGSMEFDDDALDTWDDDVEYETMTVSDGQGNEWTERIPVPAVDANEQPEQAVGTITVPMHVLEVAQLAPSGIEILQTCIDIAVFLCEKNISYGDSALNPIRAFSKASPVEQILVRIDDKISRKIRGSNYEGDDNDLQDLLGYLVLYEVAKKYHG
jgi:hypothetical protein